MIYEVLGQKDLPSGLGRILVKFGTEIERYEPPHPHQGVFSIQNTTGILPLCYGINWDAEIQNR